MTRMTAEDVAKHQARMGKPDPLQEIIVKAGFTEGKVPKYRNKKVVVDGITFHSKGEFQRWQELQMMERAGKISNLCRQVVYELAPAVTIGGKKRPPLRYTADFVYTEGSEDVVEDFKNPATAAECSFRIRQHLMKHVHGIEIKVTIRKSK